MVGGHGRRLHPSNSFDLSCHSFQFSSLIMTRYSIAFSALMATAVTASGAAYSQCGGKGWTGATDCVSGYQCQVQNDWYSQCVPGTAAVKTSAAAPTTVVATTLSTMKRPSGKK